MLQACYLEYIGVFLNFAFMLTFSTLKLCCRSGQKQLDSKIKVLILLPLGTSMFTASIALYYLLNNEVAECIYYGSTVAMLAIDLDN